MPSPEFQVAAEKIRNMPLPDESVLPAERRRLYEQSAQYPMPPEATTTPVDAGGVPCEWVLGRGADPGRRLLYLHGGGYVLGNLNTHRDLAAILSEMSGAATLAVDYRLAPEHPFPAAVDDALAAYRFLLDNGSDGPGRADDVYIAGDSAGGGLALATMLAARDAGLRFPDAAVSMSGWTDLTMSGGSFQSRLERDIRIRKAGLEGMAAAYLAGVDPRTPLASPLYADLEGLPPLLLQVGDPEVLLDDTRLLAEQARAAGIEVREEIWPDMFHVWQHQWASVPEARDAVERIGAFCKAHTGARV